MIRSKSRSLRYLFTFNVVITHEIITFQDICAENANEFEAAEYNCWCSWNQIQQKIALYFHLLAPARGTSHRIMPAQLLNRQRISSSSTSHRSSRRNFSQDHASAVTEQTEDLVYIHINLNGALGGTSHRIILAQLLNRQRISSSSTYISSEL